MDEGIWEEIGELRAQVEELKCICGSIQEYFRYLTDPIEAAHEPKEGDGEHFCDKSF